MINYALGRLNTRSTTVYRGLIALALLAVCIYIGQATPTFHLASYDLFTVVMIGLGGALFLFLSLRNLQFGLFAIVVAALFIQFTLGTGSGTRIPASMVLTALMVGLWLVAMLVRKKVQLFPSPVNIPLLGFVAVSIFSLPWSWLFSRPDLFLVVVGSGTPFQFVQLGGLALMVLLPMLFLLALNVLRDRIWIQAIYRMILLAGILVLPAGLLRLPVSFGALNIETGGLFPLWLISLAYAQILFNDQLKLWQRLFLGILALGWLYYQFGIGTTWFSGWMPAMVALLFLTYRKSKKAALLALVLIAIPFLVNPTYFYNRIWVKAQAADFNRFTIWPTVISLTLTHTSALFGAGPVGYIPLYRSFVLGPAWSAHNNYVDIFAETGIIGFSFFIWFLFATFRTGWSLDSKLQDGFLRAFNNGALGALVGTVLAMVLGDWFIPFVYNIGYVGFDYNAYAWISLGAMVGLQRFAGNRVRSAPVANSQAPAAPDRNDSYQLAITPTSSMSKSPLPLDLSRGNGRSAKPV